MLLEYRRHTGDIKILRRYYFDCRTILEAFRRCIDTNTGLLGQDLGLCRLAECMERKTAVSPAH